MNANSATKPRMMPIKNLAKNGPVGVLKPRCITTSERISRWAKMHQFLARFSEPEVSNRPHPRRTPLPVCPGLGFRYTQGETPVGRSRRTGISYSAGVEKISGPIRLSAPIDLGRSYLVAILDAFLAEHAEVTIDLNLTDGYVDLVGQGQDLAIRYGELADSTLRVKRLGNNRRVVCASPAYLESKGLPRHPDDLAHHECILMRFGQTIDREWPFLINGEARRVAVRGHRIANDGGLVRDWCRNGYGIARKSVWDIEADLKAGTLVELLREFSAGSTGLQIVYPATQDQPKRVRLLIEKIAEAFSSSAATPP